MNEYKPAYDRSYALVVAIDEYHHLEPLQNAVRGANMFADLLRRSFGFEVTTLFNGHATKESILGWLSALETSPDDRLLFYFAGHGLTRETPADKFGYLALDRTERGRYLTALKMGELVEELDFAGAKHVLAVIDACFSGLALHRTRSAELTRVGEEQARKLAASLLTRPVRYVITAGGAEVVDDNASPDGKLSLFTHYLLRGLQGGVSAPGGLLRARQLANYVEEQVAQYRHSRHKPNHGHLSVGGEGDGDFIFQLPVLPIGNEQVALCEVYDPRGIVEVEEHSIAILQRLRITARLTILEKITIGQSGSSVYLVAATGHNQRDIDGLYYCKIYRTPSGQEEELHRAVSATPIGRFVPSLADTTPNLNGWRASLYDVAHQTTLRGSQSLSSLLNKNMRAAYESILKLMALLRLWNGQGVEKRDLPPRRLLEKPLERFTVGSDRSTVDAAARVASFIDELTVETIEIQYGKHALPNPLAYYRFEELWSRSRPILWPSGHVHGDLHTNNIICLLAPGGETVVENPVMIDFDTYENQGCIFFDLAYLEIDIAMRMFAPVTAKNREVWLAVSEFLTQELTLLEIPPLHPDCFAMYSLLVPIRKEVAHICDKQPADFVAAYWISRTAAGLSFARKRKLGNSERKLALLLAAHSLKKALEELEIESDQAQQPVWVKWIDIG